MKKIKAISIWNNGQLKSATCLYLIVNTVNLNIDASFYYKLMSDDGINLANGSLSMIGEDYQNWQSDDYAWDWAAQQLNIEYDLDNSVDSNS